jgi:hypothetical protein
MQGNLKLSQINGSNTSIKAKHNHNSLINIIPLSYLRDDYHKQAVLISESRGNSN